MAKIGIFYANAGEGHRKVAESIRDELVATFDKNTQIVCRDSLDYTYPFFKASYPSCYKFLVTKAPGLWGWVYDFFDQQEVFWFWRPLRRIFNRIKVHGLEKFFIKERFDIIISTHFQSAEIAAALKRKKKIESVVFTVITDFSAHTLWVNPGTDYYAVMHPDSAETVVARGGDEKSVFVTGIPVNREFLELYNRPEVLDSLGLDTNKKTILLTSGGFGMGPIVPMIRSLERYADRIQLIVVSGRNAQLKEQLERLETTLPLKILGFVDYMPKLMAVSDLIIAKAGGSTVCESLAVGLPLAIFSYIPGQEERNVNLLLKYSAARKIEKPQEIEKVVNDLLHQPEAMRRWREGIRSVARPFAAKEVVVFIKSFLEMKKG